MKQKIIPIVSVLLGLVAFVLTYQYLHAQLAALKEKEQELYRGARKIYVVAAAQDLPEGAVIKNGDIGRLQIFETSANERMILPEEANMIVGRKTVFPIKAMNAILWPDIEGGATAAQGLAPMITHGMRAISLSIGGAASVSGMVEPNDRVDVLGTFWFPSKTVAGEMETVTLTVLQDVTVLATGQRLAKQQASDRRRPSTTFGTVTLEVTPREAELLVFTQQLRGSLTLALRNPTDVSFEANLPEINFDKLEKSMPELNLYRQRTIRHKRDL